MKVYISQPMAGKSDREIIAEREWIKAYLERKVPKMYKEGFYQDTYDGVIEIIENFFQGTEDKPLKSLAKSLELLAEADLAVFAPGWMNTRGCRIEFDCCKQYGIPSLEDIE
jgi:hypothetical protein